MRQLFAMILAMMSLVACEVEIEEIRPSGSMVPVRFYLDLPGETRSSISPDEAVIKDINVYAFRNGMLVDEVYTTSADAAVLNLPVGYVYDIYAVANMGRVNSMARETDFVKTCSYSIDDVSDLGTALPMSCVCRNVYVGTATNVVKLQMERLAAKVSLLLDKGSLMEGLQVKSVRLRQSASVVKPFKWSGQGGSRTENTDETIYGDYASDEDLVRLNSGEEIIFYTLENCQGILLPENTIPSEKAPGLLGDKEELCTYLEVCCSFGSEGIFDGDVNYRIYLGLDSTSSFDVPGNACINVSLMLTDDGLRDVSWKVDSDVSLREGYAFGYVSQGMHPVNGLYVGEAVLYEVEFADELYEYLGGDVSGCSLVFIKDGMSSDDLLVTDLSGTDNVLTAELRCHRPVAGALYLYSREGECLGCVADDVLVKIPKIVLAESSQWVDQEPVEPFTYAPECEINGDPVDAYVYYVDDEGYNLNGDRSYDFDPTLFDIGFTGAKSGTSVVAGMRTDYRVLDGDVPGQAAALLSVYCDNDGTDHAENMLLTELYNLYKPVTLGLRELNFGVDKNLSVELSIPQICLTLVDNGWAKYHVCQLSMLVDNPSNLPLEVSVWQLITTKSTYEPVDESYVENNLIIDHIPYMTGEFYNGDPTLYGSGSSFISERNECGSEAMKKDAFLIYPLTGISTDDIRKAMYYNRCGNHQMMHTVDVSLNGKSLRTGDVVLEDKVSDGSATFDYIYYHNDSWNYRGAGLFSYGELVSYSSRWAYDYPNVSACRLDRLFDRYSAGLPITLNFKYNSSAKKVTLLTNSGNVANYDMSVSVRYQGKVNGYVQTYPKGTLYAPQDNNCSVDIDDIAAGIPLKVNASYTWADDGILKESMDKIYEFSYLDSPKALGSDAYLHRAHPVNMNLSVSCVVEGDAKRELFPMSTDWKFNSVAYYHQQENTNYNCTLSAEIEEFNIVVVRHK